MSLQTGQSIGPYKIIGKIGSGGMAHVYRARQEMIERDVAIKIVQTERGDTTELTARFKREAQTIARLSHPHIIKVFDYGRDGDTFYLVMELFDGGTLSDRIHQGPLAAETARAILQQIADALDYIHKHGIIHRDLKPSNILFDRNGYAILTDFGISKRTGTLAALTMAGTAIGTLAYMAPEQLHSSDVDKRVDVYALGVVLYEMLTGELPFVGETPDQLVRNKMQESLPSILARRPELPAAVQQVLEAAVALSRDHRYPSAGSLSADFDRALKGEPLNLVPVSASPAYAVTQIETSMPVKTAPVVQAPGAQADKTMLELPQSAAQSGRRRLLFLIAGLFIALLVVGGAAIVLINRTAPPAGTPTSAAVQSTAEATATLTATPAATQPAPSPTVIPTLPVLVGSQAATANPPASETPSPAPSQTSTSTPSLTPTPTSSPTPSPATPPTTIAEKRSGTTPTAGGLMTLPAVETLFAAGTTATAEAGVSVPTELVPLLRFVLVDSKSLKRTSFNCGVFQQVVRSLKAIADGNGDPAQAAEAKSLAQNPATSAVSDYCADPSTPQEDHALKGDPDINWGNLRLAMNSVYSKYSD